MLIELEGGVFIGDRFFLSLRARQELDSSLIFFFSIFMPEEMRRLENRLSKFCFVLFEKR